MPNICTDDPAINVVGLDYKSDGLYVSSDGEVCGSPKYYRRSQDKLAKEQKRLSRKRGSRKGEPRSGKYIRQQLKINRIHRHIANQRLDFLHKQSTAIANRYNIVCVESLDMKAVSNEGFGNGKSTILCQKKTSPQHRSFQP
ncbi:MAG: transposase [Lachnospiraceae bacterium]|nr:transposase [Lachnospiraceae bacterium]